MDILDLEFAPINLESDEQAFYDLQERVVKGEADYLDNRIYDIMTD